MNFLTFFKRSGRAEEPDNELKIYLDEELYTYKTIKIEPFSTGETVLDSLRSYPDIGKTIEHIKNFNTDKLILSLVIRHSKNKTIYSRRRINPFELIHDIIQAKEGSQELIWLFRIDHDKGGNPDKRSRSYSTLTDSKQFHTMDQPTEVEKYERSGVLMKRSKKGDFKEKKFILYKESLIYYSAKDKGILCF